jgi:predicted PurR-regulated permease PerM
VLLLLGGLWLAAQLSAVIVAVVMALVLVGTLNPICAVLEARGASRTVSVLLVFTAILLGLGLVGFLTVPALISQVRELIEGAPEVQARLIGGLSRKQVTAGLARLVAGFKLQDFLPSGKQAFEYSSQVANVIGWSLTTLALTFYFLADPPSIQAAVYAVVPRRFHVRLARISLNLETIVGGYMRGQVITSVLMSLFIYVLLRLCRIHNPLPLAIFAGLTDVLPLIGGILGALPLVAAALPRGSATVLIVIASVVCYQEIENRLIIPRVYGRVLRLPAWALTVALLVGATLMGIVGALLALPVAAGLRMILEELRVDLPGDAVADPAVRERDEEVEDLYAELTQGAGAQTAASIALDIADSVRKADAADPTAASAPVVPGLEP